MKIGVFTVMLPDLSPETAAQELQDAGYDGVEWRVTHIPPERQHEAPSFWGNNLCTLEPTETDAQRARDLAAEHNLEIPGLGTYLVVGDLAAAEDALRFAQIAGTPQIRIGLGFPTARINYHEQFATTQRYLSQIETLAQQYNIKALIEMHHRTIHPSASLAHRLVCDFDPQSIGVIYDAGNMVYEGYEEYQMGMELLGPYLAHVHLKNSTFARPAGGGIWTPTWAPLSDGVVDFPRLFAALRAVGYDDWLVVEDFSAAKPSRQLLRDNIAFIRHLLNENSR